MELSVAIYEEITGECELPPPVDEADHERRKHRRVPFGHRATITTQRKGVNAAPNVVLVRDVSIGGLSFLNSELIKPGSPFLIEFRGHRDRPVKFRCLAQRCEAGGSGGTQFVVGATFEQMLTEQLPAAPQQKEEEQHQPAAMIEDPGEDIVDLEIESMGDSSSVDPDIEAAIAAALEEAVGPTPAAESKPESEKAPEPVDEPLSAEDQQKLAARLKQSEPLEERKPLVVPSPLPAPKSAAPALIAPAAEKPAPVAAPVKASGLFINSGSAKPKPQFEDEWGSEAAPQPQAQAVQAPPPAEEGPVFRVIMLPDPPLAAAAEMELGPSTPSASESSTTSPAPTPEITPEITPPVALHIAPVSEVSGVNGNEVLAKVKEVLLSQERTIKAQRQQIKEDREKTTKELESLRAEMAQMQRKLAEIQARKDADDRAIADLASVLATCEQDVAESVKPKPEATTSKSEAA